MLIIDYSGIAMASLFSQNSKLEENLLRHLILNSIRMYKHRYAKYGELVIACDGGSWRRTVFPEYKAKRRSDKTENKSGTDWDEFYRIINLVKDELIEHFPYKVVQVKGAEADDIIAVLVEDTQEFGKCEDVMIISADHDFIQLQKYKNVKQFSSLQKKAVVDKDPIRYLFEHTCRGCGGDGVPNILSPDNTFTDGLRQKPLSAKMLAQWQANRINHPELTMFGMPEEVYRNWKRNDILINFDNIPQSVKDDIIDAYNRARVAPKSMVLPYLISKRCNQLIGSCQDFF